jgi:hypothetical protein
MVTPVVTYLRGRKTLVVTYFCNFSNIVGGHFFFSFGAQLVTQYQEIVTL